MILDQLDNALLYGSLGQRIAVGLALLNEDSVRGAAPGKYEVDGDNLFYVVNEYDTEPVTDGKLEIHRKYLDIQYIVSGSECIGHSPLEDLQEISAYDGQTDLAFYKPNGRLSRCILQAGSFAIFWPNEPHMPGRIATASERVKKIVVKVKVE